MATQIKFGDIIQEVNTGIIVHGCNAQGVMNSGIAKQIRETYHGNFVEYNNFCKHKTPESLMGKVCFFSPKPGLIIANAITQLNYGRDSEIQYVDYQAVQTAFRTIADYVFNLKLSAESRTQDPSLHYPTIGAGLGNGDWSLLNNIIDNELARLNTFKTLWLLPKK